MRLPDDIALAAPLFPDGGMRPPSGSLGRSSRGLSCATCDPRRHGAYTAVATQRQRTWAVLGPGAKRSLDPAAPGSHSSATSFRLASVSPSM